MKPYITPRLRKLFTSLNYLEAGESPLGGLGWTCPPHFCQKLFLRLM